MHKTIIRRLPSWYFPTGLAVLLSCLLSTPGLPQTLRIPIYQTPEEQQQEQEGVAPEGKTTRWSPDRSLEKILGRDLVGTEFRRAIELSFGPKWEDIADRNSIRFDIRLKYGLTDNWMTAVRVRFHINNPLTDKDEWGLGVLRLESKYRLKGELLPKIQTAAGIKLDIPLSDDPDLSDGIYHLTPYITFMRVVPSWHWAQVYTQFGVDIFLGDVGLDDLEAEQVDFDGTFVFIAPGIIFPRPPLFYFLDVEWQTNWDDNALFITPGIRWEIPKQRWLPGLWTIEIGPRIEALGSEEVGLAVRILWESGPKTPQQNDARSLHRPFGSQRWWSRL